MDLELIEKTSNLNKLPIVYCDIGSINDIKDAFKFNISGVSVAHFLYFMVHNAVLISYPLKI